MNVTAQSFSGVYGSEKDRGDIIEIEIIPGSNNIRSFNETGDNLRKKKEVILLIDISASMHNSMKYVKSSVLAFRDSILGLNPKEMEKLNPETRDRLIRETITIRIITFSNMATEIWSPESESSFEEVVIGLEVESMTNMGDALKLAFSKTDPEKYSWVIVMTDGDSNQGPCRTATGFHRLISKHRSPRTKIITLGYGDEFDPEVLNRVGNFVYIEHREIIPVVLGNLAEEILTATKFNCVIDILGKEILEFNDYTVIEPEGEGKLSEGKVIVGDRVTEALCEGKTYRYVYLPHGNNQSESDLNNYKTVQTQYEDIGSGEIREEIHEIQHRGLQPSEDIRSSFFEEETRRLIYHLYRSIQTKNKTTINRTIKTVEARIKDWTDEISEPCKEKLLKLIETIKVEGSYNNNRGPNYSRLASATLYDAVGTGYADFTDDNLTLSATEHYLVSPLINITNDL